MFSLLSIRPSIHPSVYLCTLSPIGLNGCNDAEKCMADFAHSAQLKHARTLLGRCVCKRVNEYTIILLCTWRTYVLSEHLLVVCIDFTDCVYCRHLNQRLSLIRTSWRNWSMMARESKARSPISQVSLIRDWTSCGSSGKNWRIRLPTRENVCLMLTATCCTSRALMILMAGSKILNHRL